MLLPVHPFFLWGLELAFPAPAKGKHVNLGISLSKFSQLFIQSTFPHAWGGLWMMGKEAGVVKEKLYETILILNGRVACDRGSALMKTDWKGEKEKELK